MLFNTFKLQNRIRNYTTNKIRIRNGKANKNKRIYRKNIWMSMVHHRINNKFFTDKKIADEINWIKNERANVIHSIY